MLGSLVMTISCCVTLFNYTSIFIIVMPFFIVAVITNFGPTTPNSNVSMWHMLH